MADSSSNPEDIANMRRLEARMEGLVAQLQATLRQAESAVAKDTQRTRRADSSTVRRESQVRGARAPGARAIEEEPALANKAAQAHERGAKAQETSVAATREQNRLLQEQQRMLTTGTGGGGGRPPAAPPTAAAGAGGEPPRRNLTDALNYKKASDEARKYGDEEARLLQRAKAGRAGTESFNAALQRETRALGLSSDAMRRHGALTSEFISAAARGQTTIRELGFQVGATIGKFAGWTAAASAVFAVVGAMKQLGDGAIQSNKGVNQLARVVTGGALDTDRARQQFRDLAREFNLPIEEVASAAYGMAKVFHDQESIMSSTRQALFAVKVGELDAITATRALTSIIAGFNLTAGEMPAVLDAINQVQNKFGGNVGQMVVGVSKAAGAFKLAGGSYRDLLVLLQTGVRAGGATAENVATALSRSASVVLTKPGQERLKSVGLDPSRSISQLYEDAAKLYADAGERGEKVLQQEIIRALIPSGGQWARIVGPILRSNELRQQVRAQTDPKVSGGSAERELATSLKSVEEQVKKVGVGLQTMGSALEHSGALDTLGGLLFLLNHSLDVATRLVELFTKIPAPFRNALVAGLELYAVLRLMRRFNVGGALPQAGPYGGVGRLLSRNPEHKAAAEVRTGMQDTRAFLENERRAAGLGAAQQIRKARFEQDHLAQLNKAHAAGQASDADLIAQQRKIDGHKRESVRLAAEQEHLAKDINQVQRQRGEFDRRVKSGQSVAHSARATGQFYSPGTLDRPSATQPVPVPFTAGPGDTRVQQAAGRYRAQTAQMAQRLSQVSVLGRSVNEGPVVRALGAAGAGVVAGTRGVAAVGKGMAGFARSVASSLGPLDVALIGITTAFSVYSYVQGRLAASEQQIARLGSAAGGSRAVQDRARHELGQKSLMDRAQSLFVLTTPGQTTRDEAEDAAARDALEAGKAIAKAQKKGVASYLPDIADRLKSRRARATTNAEEIDAIEQALQENMQSYARLYGGKEARKAAQEQRIGLLGELRDLRLASDDIQKALDSIADSKSAESFGQAVGTRIQRQGLTPYLADASGQAVTKINELLKTRGLGVEERAKQIQAQQQIIDQALQAGQEELTQSLDRAANTGESGQARQEYLSRMRSVLGGPKSTMRQRRQLQSIVHEQERAQFQAELATFDTRTDLFSSRTADPYAQAKNVAGRLKRRVQRVKSAMAQHLATEDEVMKAIAEQNQALQRLSEARIDDFRGRQELSASNLALSADATGDQAGVLRNALGQASALVAKIRGEGKRLPPSAMRDALKGVNDAKLALQQYVREQAQALEQAQFAFREAGIDPGDQIAVDNLNIQRLRSAQKFARTPAEKLQAGADLRAALKGRQRDVQQRKFENIEFDAQIGRIDQQVEISRLSGLLKTLGHNRELKRQVQARLYELRHQGSGNYELDVGSIRLPTPYEVNRAVREGRAHRAAGRFSSVMNNEFNINVRGKGDLAEFADTMDSLMDTHARSTLRAAGEL